MFPSTSVVLDPILTLKHGQVGEGMRVADFGCGGHGHFTFALADLVGHRGMVYAVDILPGAIESIANRARQENVRHVQALRGDIERVASVPIPSGVLHRVVLINTLHQLTDRMAVFVEARRVLTAGGLLLVVERILDDHRLGAPRDLRIDEATALSLAHASGFTPGRGFTPNPHYWGRVFQMSA